MDATTIKLHRAIVRHLKGILTAYDQWVEEEELAAATVQLKLRRQEALLDNSRISD